MSSSEGLDSVHIGLVACGDPQGDGPATDAGSATDAGPELDAGPPGPEGLRILMLGPADLDAADAVDVLTQSLEARGAAGDVHVEAVELDTLLNFFHAYTERDPRLSVFDAGWDFVVLADTVERVEAAELSFEGARGLAELARDGGAVPLFMASGQATADSPAHENLWRIGLGAGAHVVSRAVVSADASVLTTERHLATAACIYSAIIGEDAAATGYVPDFAPPQRWVEIAAQAHLQAMADSAAVHYTGDHEGVVRIEPSSSSTPYNYMTVGSSSEAGWAAAMGAMLTHEGLSGSLRAMGACGSGRVVDDTCLGLAAPYFASDTYQVLFARWYFADIDTIRAAANDPELMPQVYDRHYDGLDHAGEAAIDALETRSLTQYGVARDLGLAWLPHHINFARIKHQDDSVMFTSDGTHAHTHVNRGMAAMSYVSRTGLSPVLTGLTGHTRLAVEEGERTIRQLATLSIGGATVADTPENRVAIPAVDLSDTPMLPDCAGPQTACQSGCADTTEDAANCGACAVACAVGETCVDSECWEECGAEVCTHGETCVAGSCEPYCQASVGAPTSCGSNSAAIHNCENLFDEEGLTASLTGVSGASCLADGTTPHCTYGGGCTAGCVGDLWFRFDLDEGINVNGLSYLTDWHNKTPNHWELWVSDSLTDTPDGGAVMVASGVGQPSPWRCVAGESCADATVPDICCPDGRDQPQDTTAAGEFYPLYNSASFPLAYGRHWYFVVRDTHYPPSLILSEVQLTCDLAPIP